MLYRSLGKLTFKDPRSTEGAMEPQNMPEHTNVTPIEGLKQGLKSLADTGILEHISLHFDLLQSVGDANEGTGFFTDI